LDQFRATATDDFIGTFLIPKWSQYRDEGSAAKPGPSSSRRIVLTGAVPVSADEVSAPFCAFDDGVSYRYSDGTVLDDEIVVEHGDLGFSLVGGVWLLAAIHQKQSTTVASDSTNPCQVEAVVK
jgi:hypothetical protein